MKRKRAADRRGMTVIVLLGVVSIAIALAYSVMRSQGTAIQIQENSGRRNRARQAAMAGLSVGLKAIHDQNWAGVDSPVSGAINDLDSFVVTFATGDSSLQPGGADYGRWPYRVTLSVTGTSNERAGAVAPSSHKIRAVVELSPKKLSAEPPDWAEMLKYTVYQTAEADFTVEVPSRIEGPLWIQGRVDLCADYPDFPKAKEQYLSDLKAMSVAGVADYRPMTGPLHLRNSMQPGSTTHLLQTELGLTMVYISSKTATGWDLDQVHTTYKLYPGGKSYNVPTVGSTLANVTLKADPLTNPLGIFFRDSEVTLSNNVTIEGTLISRSDILITGDNVHLKPISLLGLDGSSQPVRLPAAIAGGDLRIGESASGSATGILAAADEFEVKEGAEDAAFAVDGRVITRTFMMNGRTGWDFPSDDWVNYLYLFDVQKSSSDPDTPYFPIYMGQWGCNPKPLLTIKPPSSPVLDHWKEPLDPVYIPDAAGEGLRWDLLEWADQI